MWKFFYNKSTRIGLWITICMMTVSSFMYVSAPFILKKLIDGMTKTIASPEFATAATSGGLMAKIATLGQYGSQIAGAMTLQKFLGGLGLYALVMLISTAI